MMMLLLFAQAKGLSVYPLQPEWKPVHDPINNITALRCGPALHMGCRANAPYECRKGPSVHECSPKRFEGKVCVEQCYHAEYMADIRRSIEQKRLTRPAEAGQAAGQAASQTADQAYDRQATQQQTGQQTAQQQTGQQADQEADQAQGQAAEFSEQEKKMVADCATTLFGNCLHDEPYECLAGEQISACSEIPFAIGEHTCEHQCHHSEFFVTVHPDCDISDTPTCSKGAPFECLDGTVKGACSATHYAAFDRAECASYCLHSFGMQDASQDASEQDGAAQQAGQQQVADEQELAVRSQQEPAQQQADIDEREERVAERRDAARGERVAKRKEERKEERLTGATGTQAQQETDEAQQELNAQHQQAPLLPANASDAAVPPDKLAARPDCKDLPWRPCLGSDAAAVSPPPPPTHEATKSECKPLPWRPCLTDGDSSDAPAADKPR